MAKDYIKASERTFKEAADLPELFPIHLGLIRRMRRVVVGIAERTLSTVGREGCPLTAAYPG
jgi:hypothetical protein